MSFNLEKFLPKSKSRFTLPSLNGSADAFILAKAGLLLKKQQRMLLVIVAHADDGHRLLTEIPWFDEKENKGDSLRCRLLPDWETLPYDSFSPHQDLISERLATLFELQNSQCDVLLVPATTALIKMAPPSFIATYTFFFKKNMKVDETRLRSQMALASYSYVTQVISPGEYSLRGNLIDIFPMGSSLPYRLDLFGDTIENIRVFNPDTQRSMHLVEEVRLLPGREFPMDEIARLAFRNRWRKLFEGDPSRSTVYKDMGNGIPSAGIEYYLPLFFEETANLFTYIPKNSMLSMIGDVEGSIQNFWCDTESRYKFLKLDCERPLLPPKDLFLTSEDFFLLSKPYSRWIIRKDHRVSEVSELSSPIPRIFVDRSINDPLANLRTYLLKSQKRVMICAESSGRRETLQNYFREYDLPLALCENYPDFVNSHEKLMLATAPLRSGFELHNYIFITETELYAHSTRRVVKKTQESKTQIESIVRDLSELKIGDPVVHANHGIGRYMGLFNTKFDEGETEFLHLEYGKNSRLYVPVSQLHIISRYSGTSPENAPLHILGSAQWEKSKSKAIQQIKDTAAELLNIYARRSSYQGHAFKYSMNDYEEFSESFGFEETADQEAAIKAVVRDMSSDKPMDRLICGDVGFGKTEVALRAAFVAVLGGKQVAFLAPTTLLVEQHMQTFANRFANWPVKIAELSRFRSREEEKKIIRGIADGTLDIIIGTHKLLSDSIQFLQLGLVVIDEEHRFGVRQKEIIKGLQPEIDILRMTATPIPRTLSMALEGLRDFSVIATAPQKRLAIKTFVRSENESIIYEACLREIKRGGQVYFLHNEVDTIKSRKEMLEALLPEAHIGIAHGQMHERDLEKVMRDFVAHRFHILLCTTIIETGIDVPMANTIIMHRADKFGLAQLHQLRGRVGRSHHQAYAYLLVHDIQGLSKLAQRRLDAIQNMEELGSGFYLAMNDLEIRGAGEVLGDNQSGGIQEIGFQLYSEILSEAVQSLEKGGDFNSMATFSITTEVNLHTTALLPENYCIDVGERLSIYKRLADCRTKGEIDHLQEELIDRFGKLLDPVKALIEIHHLRISAKTIGVIKINAHNDSATLHFSPNPPIETENIIKLVQKNDHITMDGHDKIRITANMPDFSARLIQIKSAITSLLN